MMETSQPYLKSVIFAFTLTFVFLPIFISFVRKQGWGQKIREEGPADHKTKAGTPTMGGSVFVLAAFIVSWLLGEPTTELSMLWLVILGGFAIGCLDDLTSILKGRNLGLKARQKLVLQGALGVFPAAYLVWGRGIEQIALPGGLVLKGSWLVLLIGLLAVVATTNAVNLTDGMDGLAAGATIPTLIFFAWLGFRQQQPAVSVTALALVGGLLGFLWYNCYPAKVFMGDTGSLALGGGLAAMALVLGRPAMLILVAGIFVAEATSVIIQVSYFKCTKGKRIFRMSPFHHHFALGGMHEVQVVVRFWLVSLSFALAGAYFVFAGAKW